MLRKLFISAILLIALMPVSSWAISTTYTFNNTGNSWNVIHGNWNFGVSGSISGTWNPAGSWLTGITGALTSNNGNTTISILNGYNHSNGWGRWNVSIDRNNKTFTGLFKFKNYSYLNASASSVKLWGGADLACTRNNGSSCGTRWLGLDLWGPGSDTVEVPEPTTIGLMGLGLLGLAGFRKKKLEV